MRRIGLLPTLLAAAALCSPALGQIEVRVNGSPVYFNGVRPQEMNGRVLVPLRGVFEQLGAYVDWNPADRMVIANKGNTTIDLPVGSYYATVNGQRMQLDEPARILGGNTMVPLRFVSEAMGADVNWDSNTRTVFIDTGNRVGSVPGDYQDNRPGYAHRGSQGDQNRNQRVALQTGTVIPVTLDTALNSQTSYRGEVVTTTVRPGSDHPGIPDGTMVKGVVTQATPAENGKPGVLDVAFRTLVLPDGTVRSMSGSLISLDSKDVKQAADGRLEATGSSAKNNLTFIGIGAGAGFVIGALTKNNELLSTLIGGGLGYLYSQLQHHRAGDVKVSSGTQFGVRLDRPVSYYASYNGAYNGNNGRYYRGQ